MHSRYNDIDSFNHLMANFYLSTSSLNLSSKSSKIITPKCGLDKIIGGLDKIIEKIDDLYEIHGIDLVNEKCGNTFKAMVQRLIKDQLIKSYDLYSRFQYNQNKRLKVLPILKYIFEIEDVDSNTKNKFIKNVISTGNKNLTKILVDKGADKIFAENYEQYLEEKCKFDESSNPELLKVIREIKEGEYDFDKIKEIITTDNVSIQVEYPIFFNNSYSMRKSNSAIYTAILGGRLELVKYFCEKLKPSINIYEDFTHILFDLIFVADLGKDSKMEMFKYVAEQLGAEKVNKAITRTGGSDTSTIISAAIKNKLTDIVSLLVEEYEADIKTSYHSNDDNYSSNLTNNNKAEYSRINPKHAKEESLLNFNSYKKPSFKDTIKYLYEMIDEAIDSIISTVNNDELESSAKTQEINRKKKNLKIIYENLYKIAPSEELNEDKSKVKAINKVNKFYVYKINDVYKEYYDKPEKLEQLEEILLFNWEKENLTVNYNILKKECKVLELTKDDKFKGWAFRNKNNNNTEFKISLDNAIKVLPNDGNNKKNVYIYFDQDEMDGLEDEIKSKFHPFIQSKEIKQIRSNSDNTGIKVLTKGNNELVEVKIKGRYGDTRFIGNHKFTVTLDDKPYELFYLDRVKDHQFVSKFLNKGNNNGRINSVDCDDYKEEYNDAHKQEQHYNFIEDDNNNTISVIGGDSLTSSPS